jgi:hypothetical protein
MRTITGYQLTVHRGARAGMVRTYGPDKGTQARRFADRLDNEYGAICASVRPVFAAAVPFVDVSTVTEYGLTQKLSNAVRVF